MDRIRLSALIAFAGLTLIGLAAFADRLGLDPNAAWGTRRIIVTLLGIGLFVVAALLYLHYGKFLEITQAARLAIQDSPPALWWQKQAFVKEVLGQKPRRASILAGLAFLLVTAAYIWFVSSGLWTTWPDTTDYYDQLGSSFRHGQLALASPPDPALLTLSNPYDPELRKDIEIGVDYTLYQGRYYLYWGPVPALILAALKIFGPITAGDQYFAFAFIFGLFMVEGLLLLRIWRRFFQNLPNWMLVAGILAAGFCAPLVWMLAYPRIYDAASSGGAFFVLAGFYCLYDLGEKNWRSSSQLMLAGVLLACAIGTRMTQIFPVGFLVFAAILAKVRGASGRMLSEELRFAAMLGAPIALGLLGLGWYNWARFNSVFEFGLYYQLAGYNLRSFYQTLFSPVYMLQNFYNYFLVHTFRTRRLFPFFLPLRGNQTSLFPFLSLPKVYIAEAMTGLIYSFPFVLFAIAPLFSLFSRELRQRLKSGMPESVGDPSFYFWTTGTLWGYFLAAFIPLTMFFYAAMRYMTDFIAPLSLLAVLGFWETSRSS